MSVTLKLKLKINTENPFSCTVDRGRKFFFKRLGGKFLTYFFFIIAINFFFVYVLLNKKDAP